MRLPAVLSCVRLTGNQTLSRANAPAAASCRSKTFLSLVIFWLCWPAANLLAADGTDLRLNQIQVIGTHNSYHVAPAPALLRWLALTGSANARAFDYNHRPLPEQFGRLNIRQIELDVFADPRGGRYARPAYFQMLRDLKQDAGDDPNLDGVLDRPGLKVFHVQDVDFRTTTPTFRHALTLVRDWSRANPRHVPILILVELKDESHDLLPTQPLPFDREQIDSVDREILAVLPRDHLFTPDDLRGSADTLPEAIQKTGWPKVDQLRGKILCALDNEDAIRDRYLEQHPALRDRLMFASVGEGQAAAAWFKVNDAVRDFDRIQRLVRDGFLVRTRADVGSDEARRNDVARRDRALASGAQWISTDYPEPRREWSDYHVRWDGGVEWRRNPVNGELEPAGSGPHELGK